MTALLLKFLKRIGSSLKRMPLPGKGSTFSFTACFKLSEKTCEGLKVPETCQDITEQDLQGVHVLLAEDNPINQEVAVNLLKSFGVIADVVENGREAVNAVQAAKYDAVLMDVQMPVMNGYDAALKIRENHNFKDLPIIAMTANALKSSRDKAYSVGMNAHLTKPIMVKQLFTTLCKWIKPDPKRSINAISGADMEIPQERKGTIDFRLFKDLSCIDIETVMDRLDGNMELFEELLVLFYNNHREDKKLVMEAIEKKKYAKARELVHTIKGASGNLGFTSLYDTASVLNNNLKHERKISDPDITDFSGTMEEALYTIKKHIKKSKREKTVHSTEYKPDGIVDNRHEADPDLPIRLTIKHKKSALISTDKIKPVILIVDDEPVNIKIAGSILRQHYDITVATSGLSALAIAGSIQPPDLILLDIVMPGMDGYEVCNKLKNNEETKDIPVIFLTGKASIQDEAKGLESGAVDYITKPFNPVIVKARVKTHLKLNEYRNMLKKQSLIDGLTEIHNRRYFEENFKKEWLNALRSCSSLSVVMIDIDFFKKFNDHYGHLSGDGCLQKVASALSSTLRRPRDFVARYGGEEFVCILPDTDFSGAAKLAELLRKAIEYLHIPHACSKISPWVTISLGTATTIPGNDNYSSDDLLKSADMALYKVKETTRNGVKSFKS